MPIYSEQTEQILRAAEEQVSSIHKGIEEIARTNQQRVLEAFWRHRVNEIDLHGSTGYGLGDAARDKLESVYAEVFGAEAAIVRPQIVSGTHAIRLALFGVLRPGDHLLLATGDPYDTLQAVIGIRPTPGSLADWGIEHTVVPLTSDGTVNIEAIHRAIKPNTKVFMFQKSRGYQKRPTLLAAALKSAFAQIRAWMPDTIIVVDNCYGEFVETVEPTAYGADLAMGSLIKNPGGGLASTGGYIVGKRDLIEKVGDVLIAPGIGLESGPTHEFMRSFYQGLFLAPHVVAQALKGSTLAARVFESLGMSVAPRSDETRGDLILSVQFPTPAQLLAFCRAVQASAPIDAHVVPDAAPMPGYEDAVVMAAGAFVQGGSLELSADAPLRPPYVGYLQGGLTYEHVWLAVARIVESLREGMSA